MILPTLNEVSIEVHSQGLNNLKILHLSDLHLHQKSSLKSVEALVQLCNASVADMIVITGDIIDCQPKRITSQLHALNQLSKKTFYISGNHDLVYGIDALKKELTHLIFLDNDYEIIHFNHTPILIAGISDRFSRFFGKKREEKKILSILKEYENSILLAHQPKDYTLAVQSHTKLFLCGHTHGGQIYPFHYIVRLFQPFLAGLFYRKNCAIYVNKGLGFWGIPHRFKADAEISLLTLKTKGVQ